MKQIIKLPALLVAMTSTIIIQSCKKDKDDNVAAKTKTELITTGSWKLTAVSTSPAQDVDGDGDTETNVFDYLPACVKDNITVFKSNGALESNEGSAKCDPADPQVFTSTWSFTANDTKLIMSNAEFLLVELSENTLRLRISYAGGGVTYTDEGTYGH